MHELGWVLDFALEQGAALLQIHPLEAVGRATDELPESIPDAREVAFTWLRSLELQATAGERLRVQIDLADSRYVVEHPERVYADEVVDPSQAPLAELVSPLVVETDGTVAPLEYGFDRSLTLGNVLYEPLHALAARWRTERYPLFEDRCRRALRSLEGESVVPIVNWFDVVGGRAISA
jgi:hypothetical protein